LQPLPVRLQQPAQRRRHLQTQADVPADDRGGPAGGLDVPADDPDGRAGGREDVPDGHGGPALLRLHWRLLSRHEPGAVNRGDAEGRRSHAPCH
jgi:hypothetical protein